VQIRNQPLTLQELRKGRILSTGETSAPRLRLLGIWGYKALNPIYLKTLLSAAVLGLSLHSVAQQPAIDAAAPVPPALRNAKTIFVSNAGADSGLFPQPFTGTPSRPYAEFYNELKALGRYELVDDPSAADLVLEPQLTAPSGPQSPNKQHGASDPLPMLRLVIYDRKTHYILWAVTESVEMAYLQKTHDHNLDNAVKTILTDFEIAAGIVPLKVP